MKFTSLPRDERMATQEVKVTVSRKQGSSAKTQPTGKSVAAESMAQGERERESDEFQ